MSSSSFGVASLWLSMCSIISSTNRNSFNSFPVWTFKISFSLLIAVARASKIILNKNDESRHPCLVPELRGNTFSLSPLSMMLAVGLSYMAFIMLRYVPSMSFFWRILFYLKWVLNFVRSVFCILRWSYGFYSSVCWYGIIQWLVHSCGFLKVNFINQWTYILSSASCKLGIVLGTINVKMDKSWSFSWRSLQRHFYFSDVFIKIFYWSIVNLKCCFHFSV